MKRHFLSGSIITQLLIITIFAVPSHAQMPQSDISVPYKSITPQMETTIEKTAIIAMRHILQARADIHHKKLPSARHDLAEAARLMETIRDDLSTATAKNLIKIARMHLEYEKSQNVVHDLSLISASLDQISFYLPTDKAKSHIEKAKGYLEKNDKTKAEKELSLADNSLIVIEVELPLLKTQRFVAKAQQSLAAGNATKADDALKIAEQHAMDLYTGVHAPLFQAKQNLWLAFRNYSTATHAETRAHLAQARNNLSKATAAGSPRGNEEVNKLSSELGGLEQKLAGEGKVAESALKAAWEKSEALAERSAAYITADLSEAETTLGVESNLIETKLHVTYAETYQVTTSEPDKATKELETAYNYLQKATNSTLAGPEDHKKMREIGVMLLGLKEHPEKNDATVQERYDTIKKELSDLTINEKSNYQIHKMQQM